jgi:O-antigen ligase
LDTIEPPQPEATLHFPQLDATLAQHEPEATFSPTPQAKAPTLDAAKRRSTPWRGAIVVGVAALIAPVGYLGNEGMSPLVALGGLLTLASLFRRRWPPLGAWILLVLTVWAAASFLRSPVEALQLHRLQGYNGIQALVAPKLVLQLLLYGAFVASALALSPTWRRRTLWALAVSVAITVGVLFVEGIEGGQVYEQLSELVHQKWPPDLAMRNAARGCYGAAVLFWPAAAVMWRRGFGPGAIVIALAIAISTLMLGVDAPAAAMVLALGAFLTVRQFGRLGVWVCLVLIVIYFAFAPLVFLRFGGLSSSLPSDVGKISWHVRLDVWRFTSTQVMGHPFVGWGLDSSRAWPNHIPMHPHDAALQLWLETGAIGVALAALFWAWMFVQIDVFVVEDRVCAAVMAATAAAYLTIGAISFGVWQEWWLALGAFALAVCALLLKDRRAQPAFDPAAVIPLTPLGANGGGLQRIG